MLTSEDCISTRDVIVIATAYKKKGNPFEVNAACEIACSRLRDGGGKSFSNKKCEKRVGASRARLIFALLVFKIRSHYTI